ncbi:MAG: acyl-CoA thioesterase [Gammaproteobacteria bacterium]
MSSALTQLIELLSLEPAGEDRWRGVGSTNDGAEGTYGGHLLGQATAAAQLTIDDGRPIHSMHAYFLRGGEPGQPFEYQVERVRDGRSFSARQVNCFQHGKVILTLMASFNVTATGSSIEPAPPADFADLPRPDALPDYRELMQTLDPLPFAAEWALAERGVELRPLNAPWCPAGPSADGGIRHWIRAAGLPRDDDALQRAVLAYQSDESLSDSLLVPFGVTWGTPGTMFVSLDHAMWYHRAFDLNNWHFVEQWPGVAEESRGLAHGRVWSSDGKLVATFSQEALMRLESD